MPSFLNLRGNNSDSKDPRLIREGIKLGVNYKRFSKDPVLGKNILLRSNTVIYNDVIIGDDFKTGHNVVVSDVIIGDDFKTGHNVVVRDHTTIGNDVLIGTNTVIEGGCEIGNNVSIQSNVYIPRNSIIEDNVFIGPCACFTNDRYPVRVEYDLKGPQLRKGCSVGGNTTFLSNIEVGEGAIVAAGAVVTRSVPPYYLAIGTPAKIKPLPTSLRVPNMI